MNQIEPKIFLIGETRIVENGLKAYLDHIGMPEWTTDAPTDAEKLIEVMGRLCYRSWGPGLNKNVLRVREGNDNYINNIVKVAHGSVIEHPVMNFVFADVSRVFTHELVRHRPGTAISQESLRFVRLEDLSAWLPAVIREDREAVEIFGRTFDELSALQKRLAGHFKLDESKDFHHKKTVTSAMRRLAPDGLATTIGWSANLRTIRWVLEARTNPSAEEELRFVFAKVGALVKERYPNVFADFEPELTEGHHWYKPKHSKV